MQSLDRVGLHMEAVQNNLAQARCTLAGLNAQTSSLLFFQHLSDGRIFEACSLASTGLKWQSPAGVFEKDGVLRRMKALVERGLKFEPVEVEGNKHVVAVKVISFSRILRFSRWKMI